MLAPGSTTRAAARIRQPATVCGRNGDTVPSMSSLYSGTKPTVRSLAAVAPEVVLKVLLDHRTSALLSISLTVAIDHIGFGTVENQ
jgi:hypothetical protein